MIQLSGEVIKILFYCLQRRCFQIRPQRKHYRPSELACLLVTLPKFHHKHVGLQCSEDLEDKVHKFCKGLAHAFYYILELFLLFADPPC